ncbi:MAG: hypothetical protein ACRC18_07050 [Cetobacterium sp.]
MKKILLTLAAVTTILLGLATQIEAYQTAQNAIQVTFKNGFNIVLDNGKVNTFKEEEETIIITSEDKDKQIEHNIHLEGEDKYITNGNKGILISGNDLTIYKDKNDIDGTLLTHTTTKYFKTDVYDYKNISACINLDKGIYEIFPNFENSDYSIAYDDLNNLLVDMINYI